MGAILHPNQRRKKESRERLGRHHEAQGGKTDLLNTWEECISGKIKSNLSMEELEKENEYLTELLKRIRKERVLISHIRPV